MRKFNNGGIGVDYDGINKGIDELTDVIITI